MRLVEQLTEEGSGDFTVDAATPEQAAAILLAAYAEARGRYSNQVALPDGQSCSIEPDSVVDTCTFCILLDERGQELREVEPASAETPATEGMQEGACP